MSRLTARQARPADGTLVSRDVAGRSNARGLEARLHRDKGRFPNRSRRTNCQILPPLRLSRVLQLLPGVGPATARADATSTGHLLYLVTAFGTPHSAKAFGNWFKKRCREAGLEDLSAHGLRKLGAQRCAEAGAREHQLMALFGWTNPQQAAVYTRKANRARLEATAAPLLLAQSGNRSVPLFPAVVSGGTTGTKEA